MKIKIIALLSAFLLSMPLHAEPKYIEKPDAVKHLEENLNKDTKKESIIASIIGKYPLMITIRFAGYIDGGDDSLLVFMRDDEFHIMKIGDTWHGITPIKLTLKLNQIDVSTDNGLYTLGLYNSNSLVVACQTSCVEELAK